MELPVFILALCALIAGSMAQTSNQSLDAFTEGSNKFAVDLYKQISSGASGNVVVSPLSVQIVLTLAFCGARGRTAEELKALLRLPEREEDALNGNKQLLQQLENPVLKLATQMFIDGTFQLKDDFQLKATNYFLSTVQSLDFKGDPSTSRLSINQWVEDKTNNKIKDLLKEDDITVDTRMVLVNAIHFKANWAYQFDLKETRDEPFYVTPERAVNVPMMHKRGSFGYADNPKLDSKILEIKYEGNDFRMIVILPNKMDGLAELESKLQDVNLVEEFSNLRDQTVIVSLPKFKLEETMDLNEILKTMGAKTMFSNEADFSGIVENERIKVSKVVQKAFIEVNEEGTEAAAATAMIVGFSMPKPRLDPTFKADYPFIFILLKNKQMLFFGSTKNPV